MTKTYRFRSTREPASDDSELARSLLETASGGCEFKEFAAAEPHASAYEDRARNWGLLEPTGAFRSCNTIIGCLLAGMLLLGGAKIAVGVMRGKPVEFLLVEVIVVGVVLAFMMARPRRSLAGEKFLKKLEREHPTLKNGNFTGPEAGLAVALFGIAGCKMAELEGLHHAVRSATSADGGCGGGGGDGGGCGGGGCGGCGGCGG